MKKLAWQSILLAVSLLAVCLAARVFTGNTFTAYVPVAYMYRDSVSISLERSGGDGEVRFGEPEIRDDYIRIRVRPEQRGTVEAELYNEQGDNVGLQYYRVDRFGTVFDYSTGGFTGDSVVMAALTVFYLAESLLLYLNYRRAKGAAFYSYSTIYLAGFSLFLLLTGLMMLNATVRHLLMPAYFSMLGVYNMISSAGYSFMFVTSPAVVLFSLALIVSNLALLRHEGPRLQNALGILGSLLVLGGLLFALLVFGSDFSGSEQELRASRTVQNVYCTAYAYFECMLIGAVICGLKAARHRPAGVFDYIIILGCGFRKDGSLPPLLQGRVDGALDFWTRQRDGGGPTALLIPSGGQGPDEPMPEAEAMRRYLLSRSVPGDCILCEDRSASTLQNMRFSRELIEARGGGRVLFSTTNYHVFRSGVWASDAGLPAEGIGSRTKWWFWPNAFMRECAGLLLTRWKQELLLLLILTLLFGALSMVV